MPKLVDLLKFPKNPTQAPLNPNNDHLPPKSEHLSPKIDHHQQLVNIYPLTPKNHSLTPKNGHLRTFVVKMSQVAFARFCCQIHQSARGGDQSNLGNARILRAPIPITPPSELFFTCKYFFLVLKLLNCTKYHLNQKFKKCRCNCWFKEGTSVKCAIRISKEWNT